MCARGPTHAKKNNIVRTTTHACGFTGKGGASAGLCAAIITHTQNSSDPPQRPTPLRPIPPLPPPPKHLYLDRSARGSMRPHRQPPTTTTTTLIYGRSSQCTDVCAQVARVQTALVHAQFRCAACLYVVCVPVVRVYINTTGVCVCVYLVSHCAQNAFGRPGHPQASHTPWQLSFVKCNIYIYQYRTIYYKYSNTDTQVTLFRVCVLAGYTRINCNSQMCA